MRLHLPAILGVVTIIIATCTAATTADAQEQPPAHWDDASSHACVVPFERAQRARMQGKLVEARSMLPECLSESCPTRVRDDCARMRGELDSATPSAAFAVRDAAGNDLDLTALTVDGARVELESGRAIVIDPGPHVVTYTLAGEAGPRTAKIRIYEGEKSRLIVLTAAGARATTVNRSTAVVVTEEKTRHTAIPFIVGGAGVVLGAISLYFVARASSYDDERREASRSVPSGVGPCQDFASIPADPKFCQADKDHRTATTLAITTGAAGVVALGSAVALWFLESRPKAAAAGAAKCAARFVPTIGPTAAGASIDVSF